MAEQGSYGVCGRKTCNVYAKNQRALDCAKSGDINGITQAMRKGESLDLVLETAAHWGHLSILEHARVNKWHVRVRESVAIEATRSGYMHIVKWYKKHGHPLTSETVAVAATYGHFEIVRWLDRAGCPTGPDVLAGAARGGYIDIVKWFNKTHPVVVNDKAIAEAASGGYNNIIKWLVGRKCPMSELACIKAAANGHLHTLKLLRMCECPWNELTCLNAAYHGHMKLLTWAYNNGCAINYEACLQAAITNKKGSWIEVSAWLNRQQTKLNVKVRDIAGQLLKAASNLDQEEVDTLLHSE